MAKIAVIGVSCRFAGPATNADSYYHALCHKLDCGGKVPFSRFHRPEALHRGYFLQGDIDRFDAEFFHIGPREAAEMDPTHRMLLEETYHAFEDAGLTLDQVRGTRTASYVGILSSEYMMSKSGNSHSPNAMKGFYSFAAARLSFAFDLRGPSMLVDTMCSSSSNCVYLGMQAIRSGEATMAIAAGSNLIMHPPFSGLLSSVGVLSPDGHVKPFADSANGYARGEGIGVLILKDYDAAVRDGDPIKLVLLDAASMQDGRQKAGLTDPSTGSQAEMLSMLYAKANISPSDLLYVEAHGTGTFVGDPIEVNAIGKVLGKSRAPSVGPLHIGSVKGNIGHTESVSGIANLVKIIKSLQNNLIPPVIHCDRINPSIDFDTLNVRVLTDPLPIPADRKTPVIVGISSYGMGGSNTHIIVSEHLSTSTIEITKPKHYPIMFSAHTMPVLNTMLSEMQTHFENLPSEIDQLQFLAQLSYTLSIHRTQLAYRAAYVVDSLPTLIKELSENNLATEIPAIKNTHVVFVCSGQGPQWFAMGRGLFETFPLYKETILKISEMLQPLTGWSLIEELNKDEPESNINRTDYAQPAIFAMQVGLSVVLEAYFGIKPTCVVGHSVGEVAAAYIAGALSLEDAIKVIYHRSSLQYRASTLRDGRMLATNLLVPEAESLIQSFGMETQVCIAATNGPTGVTLSGDAHAILQLRETLKSMGKFCAVMRIQAAFHSNHMDSIKSELLDSLKTISSHFPEIPLYSTVSGDLVTSELDGFYWWLNVRQEVRFSTAIKTIDASFLDISWVELSPHPVLNNYIKDCAPRSLANVALQRRKSEDLATILQAVGQLHTVGCSVNWHKYWTLISEGAKIPQVSLPAYPFQGCNLWREEATAAAWRKADNLPPPHPLLGSRLLTLEGCESPTWENLIDLSREGEQSNAWSYLHDHAVNGTVVFPAVGYVEMVLCAASQLGLALSEIALQNVKFIEALILPECGKVIFRTVLSGSSFHIYSKDVTNEKSISHSMSECVTLDTFTLHASGEIVPHTHVTQPVSLSSAKPIIKRTYEEGKLYQHFARRGLNYGPCFQGIVKASVGDKDIWGEVRLPAALEEFDMSEYFIHPGVLDSIIQVCLCSLSDDNMIAVVPVRFSSLIVHPTVLSSFVSLRGQNLQVLVQYVTDSKGSLSCDVVVTFIMQEHTYVLLEIKELTTQVIKNTVNRVYEIRNVEEAKQQTNVINLVEAPVPVSFSELQLFKDAISKFPRWSDQLHYPNSDVVDLFSQLEAIAPKICINILKSFLGRELQKGMVVDIRELYNEIVPPYNNYLDTVIRILVSCGRLQRDSEHISVLLGQTATDVARQILTPQFLERMRPITYLVDLLQFCERIAVGVMRKDVDPVEAMFGPYCAPLIARMYTDFTDCTPVLEPILAHCRAKVAKGPHVLRVLEVGSGTGGATVHILNLLKSLYGDTLGSCVEYTFTDISSSFFSKAARRFSEYENILIYKTLNLEKDPQHQGFTLESYDIVVGVNVLHATENLTQTISHVRHLTKPHGMLFLVELSGYSKLTDIIFGLLPGWWRFNDTYRTNSPLLHGEKWCEVLNKTGYSNAFWVEDHTKVHTTIVATKAKPESQSWIVLQNPDSECNTHIAYTIGGLLETKFNQSSYATIDFRLDQDNIVKKLTEHVASHPEDLAFNIIFLCDFDASGVEASATCCLPLINVIQALLIVFPLQVPALFIVTRGIMSTDALPNLAHAPFLGFLRSYIAESKDQRVKLLDIPIYSAPPISTDSVSEFIHLIVGEIFHSNHDETEVTWKNGQRYSQRLQKFDFSVPANQTAEILQKLNSHTPTKANSAFSLEISEGELSFQETSRPNAKGKEVELRVLFVGLSSYDFQIPYVGVECSGIITEVGPDATGLGVGDEVVCLKSDQNLFSSHITVDASSVFKKPPRWSLVESAGLGRAFMIAYFLLFEKAHLSSDQVVLLHALSDGIDIAIIEICKKVGAIVVFLSDNAARRAQLKEKYGIPVFDSSSPDIGPAIRGLQYDEINIIIYSATVGVNSGLLEPNCHIIELRDSAQKPKFTPPTPPVNSSLHIVDLAHLRISPKIFAKALQLIPESNPITLSVRPITQLSEAISELATKQMEKVVIELCGFEKIAITAPVLNKPEHFLQSHFGMLRNSLGTCLITGGLGGLGLASARWLVDKGISRIALVGRRQPTSTEQISIDCIRNCGGVVKIYVADVGEYEQMKEVVSQIQSDPEMAPLIGVIHSALALKDELVKNTTWNNFSSVLKTRLQGAHNLHVLTKDLPLSFFIMYSSLSTYYGIPGQTSYNASNSYFDALAQTRSLMGLPSFSFGLPLVSGVGIADRLQYGQILTQKGIIPIFYRAALNLLEHVSCWTPYRSQFVVYDSERLVVPQLNSVLKELFVHQKISAKQTDTSTDDIGSDEHNKQKIFRGIGTLLGVDSNLLVDTKPLVEYGVDSLTSMDIQNWIEKNYHITIKISEILAGATIQTLTDKILASSKARANLSVETSPCSTPSSTPSPPSSPSYSPVFHPVTPFQEGILMQTMFNGSTMSSFNVAASSKVAANFSFAILQRAVDALVQRHKLFFAHFSFSEGQFLMQLLPYKSSVYLVEQFSATSENLQDTLTELANKEFDIFGGVPLARFALIQVDNSSNPTQNTPFAALLLSVHHIICDAQSFAVLCSELTTLYENLATNPTVHYSMNLLPRIEVEFVEVVAKQQATMDQRIAQHLPFWKRELSGEIPDLLSGYRRAQKSPDSANKKGSGIVHYMPQAVFDKISELACKLGKTPFSLWCTGIIIMLYHYTNNEDICFGVSTTDRPPEAARTLAPLINTVVVRNRVNLEASISELISSVSANILGAIEKDIPYTIVQSQLGLARNVNARPLYQIHITQPPSFPPLFDEKKIIFVPLNIAYHDLSFKFMPKGILVIEYACDLFSKNAILQMSQQLAHIYEKMGEYANSNIQKFSMISEAEKLQIETLAGGEDYFSSTFSDCVHLKFEKQVLKTPNATALVFNNSITTYLELNNRANEISAKLQEREYAGLIGIYLEKSVDQIAAIIGVLKAGYAYVPLDPSDPLLRTAQLLQHAEVGMVLTSSKYEYQLAENASNLDLIMIDQKSAHTTILSVKCKETSAFCVIYTSGSTGQPKGVIIPHSVPAHRVEWDPFPIKKDDVFCFRTSFCFIDSIWEIFAPLTHGNKLIIPSSAPNDLYALVDILQQHQVTRSIMIPTILESLLNTFPDLGSRLPRLAVVESTGEPLQTALAKKFVTQLPGKTLMNMYGLSETWDSSYKIIRDLSDLTDNSLVSLGATATNAFNLVLNESLIPCPINVYGQLAIGGYGIAFGYLNEERQTDAKFKTIDYRGRKTRVFLTGDRARFNDEGELEFHGRFGTQFKVNGLIVLPETVESVLATHPDVSQAVIGKAKNQIFAAIVLKSNAIEREEQQAAEQRIRTHLQKILPSWHVPSVIAFFDALPLLPNGKRNRAKINDCVEKLMQEHSQNSSIVYPSTNTENAIYNIWKELLPGEFGVTNNFFSLGGNSILAKIIWKKLNEILCIDIQFPIFIQHATIKELACAITSGTISTPPASIVPLNTIGSKPPLFCVHPATGYVFLYYNFVKYLEDVPFYGIQSSQLVPRVEGVIHESVQQLAKKYISEMLATQPEGPYYLSGFSFGGLVAYEMAQQLKSINKKVAALLLFDTWPPVIGHAYEEISLDKIRILKAYLSNYEETHRDWLINVYKMYIESAQQYQIQPLLDIPVVLFQAKESNAQKFTPWADLIQNLHVEEIPGNHFNIFTPEHVESFGTKVNGKLKNL